MANVTRRQAREWALQMLFQADLNPGMDLDVTIPKFWNQQFTYRLEEAERSGDPLPEPPARKGPPLPLEEGEDLLHVRREDAFSERQMEDGVAPPKMRLFAETRVRGVIEHLEEIDAMIQKFASNWEMYRLGTVERNVMRLAYYELVYCPDVPPPVVLNEAIDLAKYFSNADAGRFVNGILDKMRKTVEEARRTKAAHEKDGNGKN